MAGEQAQKSQQAGTPSSQFLGCVSCHDFHHLYLILLKSDLYSIDMNSLQPPILQLFGEQIVYSSHCEKVFILRKKFS